MRVAVVTPYYRESLDFLRQCHESVAGQSYPCIHVMVADGAPKEELSGWPIDHVILPGSHNDVGSTPRLVGSYHAIGLGVDAVAFLDADNWYRADHIETLVSLQKSTGAAFLSSNRMLCRRDGSIIGACTTTDPEKFIDTSCMMFERAAFSLLAHWTLMPSYAHIISDQVVFYHVRAARIPRAHSQERSVFYRCNNETVYQRLGEPVPPGAVPSPEYGRAYKMWAADGHPPLT